MARLAAGKGRSGERSLEEERREQNEGGGWLGKKNRSLDSFSCRLKAHLLLCQAWRGPLFFMNTALLCLLVWLFACSPHLGMERSAGADANSFLLGRAGRAVRLLMPRCGSFFLLLAPCVVLLRVGPFCCCLACVTADVCAACPDEEGEGVVMVAFPPIGMRNYPKSLHVGHGRSEERCVMLGWPSRLLDKDMGRLITS